MVANLYYDVNGETWTAINFKSQITFSSERGLKQAIRRKIQKDLDHGNLRRFFGTGAKVSVNVYTKLFANGDKPIATTTVTAY